MIDWYTDPGGSRNTLVASCFGNRDKPKLDGPLGLSTNLSFFI